MTHDYAKQGKRITLFYTDDPYTNLRNGDMGTVQFINRSQNHPKMRDQVYIKWDNGSNLSLLIGKDIFEIKELE